MDSETIFQNRDWMQYYQRLKSPWWKRVVYFVARPLLSKLGRHYLSSDLIKSFPVKYVLPGRGLPLEDRRGWANSHYNLRGKNLLIQGTGTGWDVISWLNWQPQTIMATDLFYFDSWQDIKAFVISNYPDVKSNFVQASLEESPFPANYFDAIVSDAVYEHCKDLLAVMLETYRLLRPNGIVYASYGPLWYSPGGDHFSPRGGFENAYNHVALSPELFGQYFKTNRNSNEDFQSGGRYIELKLFSYLTTKQYLEIFQQAGFIIESLILQISKDALKFRKDYPDKWKQLLELNSVPPISEDDLIINSNLIILRKPN